MPPTAREFSWNALATASWYKWAVVGILAIVAFLNEVDRHAIYALFPLLEKDLSMSHLQLGMLGSAFLWAYAVLGPQAGYAGDRFPRRNVIMLSLLAWSLVTSLNAFARSGTQLIVLRALLAVTEAFYMPAALAFLAEHHPEKTRSIAVALHLSAMALGQVSGGFLGGYVGEHLNWRALFAMLGGAGVLYVPVLALVLHPAPGGGGGDAGRERLSFVKATRELRSIPTMRFLAVAFICYSIVGSVMQTWLPYYLFKKFRTSLTTAGFSAAFYLQLPTAVGNLAGGAVGDYFATRGYRGRMLTQAASLMISAPFLLGLGLAGSLPAVAISLALVGFLRAGWPPNVMPVIFQITPLRLRSTAYGFLNFLGNVSAGLALLAASSIGAHFGFGVAFGWLSSIHALAAAVLIYAAFQRLRRDFRPEVAGASEPAPVH